MKQVKRVETEYVKKTTTLLIGVGCLVAGFLIGIAYSYLGSGGKQSARSVVARQQQPQQQPRQQAQNPAQKPNAGAPSQGTPPIFQIRQRLEKNPKDAEAWAQLGHMYFDIQQYEEAIGAYRKHLELKPDNANVWTDMGVMYRRSKKPGEAVNCFDRAIKIDAKHEQARFNKGIVLMFDMKKVKEGLDSWRELVKLNPAAKAPDGRLVSQLITEFSAGEHDHDDHNH
ncbi:MAG: tetratricopeptide repeat protein [bacterium]|nr:tetratricopeptide repeat protein [bacterium]